MKFDVKGDGSTLVFSLPARALAPNVYLLKLDGKEVADWKTPGTLVTIAGEGYLDWIGPHEFAYEAGCKLFVNEQRQLVILKGEQMEVKTTDEFRARWART